MTATVESSIQLGIMLVFLILALVFRKRTRPVILALQVVVLLLFILGHIYAIINARDKGKGNEGKVAEALWHGGYIGSTTMILGYMHYWLVGAEVEGGSLSRFMLLMGRFTSRLIVILGLVLTGWVIYMDTQHGWLSKLLMLDQLGPVLALVLAIASFILMAALRATYQTRRGTARWKREGTLLLILSIYPIVYTALGLKEGGHSTWTVLVWALMSIWPGKMFLREYISVRVRLSNQVMPGRSIWIEDMA